MYTEDYKREDFPYKNFLLKFIIIIVVVAILVCIVTAFSKKKQNIEPEGYTDEVFSENLDKMKEKALKYYNENNIPKEVEESSNITLEKMIALKLITPIKDKDNKLCDNKKSYIKLTKKENEYQLKVNLVCSDEEDYTISHLNNDPSCKGTYLCDVKIDNKKDKDEKTSEEDIEEKNTENSNTTSTNSTKKSKKSNKKSSSTSKKKVRKTEVSNAKKGSIEVSDTTDRYLYEYIKTNNVKLSNWSLWNNWTTVDCNTTAITCDSNDSTCLKELKRLDRKEKLNLYNTYTSKKTSMKNSGYISASVCANYEYIKIDGTIYQLNSSSDYKKIYNVDKNTKSNVGGWIYNGRASYDTPPTDTYNTHYILVDADYSNCGSTCKPLPKYIYDKYTYQNSLVKVSNYTCNKIKTFHIEIYNSKTETIKFGRNEELYGTVCYKSERTREIISSGSSTKKWSKYNDKNLLNNGYHYTGNKKKK